MKQSIASRTRYVIFAIILSVSVCVIGSGLTNTVSATNFYTANNPFEAAETSNGRNSTCFRMEWYPQLIIEDVRAGKFTVPDSENKPRALLQVEMWKDGWYMWHCWPNDGTDSKYFCLTDKAPGSGEFSQAACGDDDMFQKSHFEKWLVNMGEADDTGGETPDADAKYKYAGNSYVDAAQKSNNGDAVCQENYIHTGGRIDCRDNAREKYWICTKATPDYSSLTESYVVECDEDNYSTEPPDYSGYPESDLTTPSEKYLTDHQTCKRRAPVALRGVICPAGDFLSEVVDATLNFLAGMMRWNYLILPEPGEKPNPGLYNWRPTRLNLVASKLRQFDIEQESVTK